jgi:hypothetical protein
MRRRGPPPQRSSYLGQKNLGQRVGVKRTDQGGIRQIPSTNLINI